MGILQNLIIHVGNIVSRNVDRSVFDWMLAVSSNLDGDPLSQAAWFIDPLNGSDSNTGLTATTALKTDAERQRRWGNFTVVAQPVTVTYLSSPPATDVVNYNVGYQTGGSLTITGTKTVTNPAIALTAVTTLNRGTQTPWDVTGVGLGATDVGRLMRITSGARLNNYCGVAKDLTGGKVRVSPFGNLDVAGAQATGVCFSQVTPQAADVVEVFTVPILTIGTMSFRALTVAIPTGTTNGIFFDTIGLDGTSNGIISMLGTMLVQGANVFFRQTTWQRIKFGGLGGIWAAGGIATNTWQVQGGFSNNGGPFCQFLGFLMTAGAFTVQAGAAAMIGGDCLFQNAACQSAGNLFGEFVSAFDRTVSDNAVQIFPGGCYRSSAISTSDLLWGDNNTGHGVKIRSGGEMTYNTKPTINTLQGAGRQSLIGGVNQDWATVPSVTAANNAMIVLEA